MRRLKTVLCFIATSLVLSNPVCADDFYKRPRGFNTYLSSVVEIQKQGRDDDLVVLHGRLVNYLGDDNYEFKDIKGDSIEVELDDDQDWSRVHRDQLITISGKIEKNMFTMHVEAKRYAIITDQNGNILVATTTTQSSTNAQSQAPAQSQTQASSNLDSSNVSTYEYDQTSSPAPVLSNAPVTDDTLGTKETLATSKALTPEGVPVQGLNPYLRPVSPEQSQVLGQITTLTPKYAVEPLALESTDPSTYQMHVQSKPESESNLHGLEASQAPSLASRTFTVQAQVSTLTPATRGLFTSVQETSSIYPSAKTPANELAFAQVPQSTLDHTLATRTAIAEKAPALAKATQSADALSTKLQTATLNSQPFAPQNSALSLREFVLQAKSEQKDHNNIKQSATQQIQQERDMRRGYINLAPLTPQDINLNADSLATDIHLAPVFKNAYTSLSQAVLNAEIDLKNQTKYSSYVTSKAEQLPSHEATQALASKSSRLSVEQAAVNSLRDNEQAPTLYTNGQLEQERYRKDTLYPQTQGAEDFNLPLIIDNTVSDMQMKIKAIQHDK